MPNETVTLRFVEFDPDHATRMLDCARTFAVDKFDGRPGLRYGTVYGFHGWQCIAYWTRARAVVVRELPVGVPDAR